INQDGRTYFSQASEDLPGFAPDGRVSDPVTVLAALPDDPYLDNLLGLYSKNKVLGNIILMARKIWYQGFEGRWHEMPDVPSSYVMTSLIEELASQIDTETATNLTKNFLLYQQKYIDFQLTALRAENGDLSRNGISELLCYEIDF